MEARANLAADTYITRLQKVTVPVGQWGAGRVVAGTKYTHLIGHCGQQQFLTTPITWLSDLPDDLVTLILCSLPLKEAGKTSILCKRWRHLWSSMPKLSMSVPKNAITNVLKLYKSSFVGLLDFSTIMSDGKFATSQEVDSWLSLACSRQVKNLVLRLDYLGFDKLPYCFGHDLTLPAFSTMKSLTLCYSLLSPSAAKCLISLEYLALGRVVLDDNIVHEVTSSCKMLRELVLRECNVQIPLRMVITNPKVSKLTIHDDHVNGRDELLLEISAPHMSTLIIVSDIARRYQLQLPSLSTLKISKLMKRSNADYQEAALFNILSGIGIRELYLSSAVLHLLGKKWTRDGPTRDSGIKVKHLHLQILNFLPLELPGLIYLLHYCDGIETLVFDFDYTYAGKDISEVNKHMTYINSCTSDGLKVPYYDESVQFESKKKVLCMNDQDGWDFLRFLLSTKMLDLKCVVINCFKRVLKIEKASDSDSGSNSCYRAVDEYEFKLLRILLKYSLKLERVFIRTKDLYFNEEVDDMGSSEYKCKNIYLDGQVEKMKIPQWDKILLSLPKVSPMTKIKVSR